MSDNPTPAITPEERAFLRPFVERIYMSAGWEQVERVLLELMLTVMSRTPPNGTVTPVDAPIHYAKFLAGGYYPWCGAAWPYTSGRGLALLAAQATCERCRKAIATPGEPTKENP